MKISIFVLLIGLLFTQFLFAQATDLFFSEYVEGSTDNKAIEIYNGTGVDVDLSLYTIKKATNGQGWTEDNFTFPENAVIHSYEVWVIANEQASSIVINTSDTVLSNSDFNYLMAFNGNDAIGLFKNDNLIDVIGTPDTAPYTGWDVAGISEATKDHTLIRKSNISQGNTDWDASAGTNTEGSEWIVKDMDYFADLGQHTFNGAPDFVPPTLISANATGVTTVEVLFSEDIKPETANEVTNYEIQNLQIFNATLMQDNRTVLLETSEQTENAQYILTVRNIQDLAGNVIEANSSITFTGYDDPYTSIAEIQDNINEYTGQEVTIKAIVTIGAGILRTDKLNAFVQDESGKGIEIFDYNLTPQYEEAFVKGNELEITGTVDEYNQVAEIKNFTYTVLSSDNPVPFIKLKISECNNLDLEGTFIQTTGVVTEKYYAGGGTNIEISDNQDPEHVLPIRIWDTTGINTDEFGEGFILKVTGVATIYNNNIQLSPGYQDDMTQGVMNPYDFLVWEPEHPMPDSALTIIFNNNNIQYDYVNINWKTNKDLSYKTEKMIPNAENTEFSYIFSSPKGGTRYQMYFEAFSDTNRTIFPENALEEPVIIEIPSFNLIAKLTVPAKPFAPKYGQTFPIDISGSNGDKAIVRIYDMQGRLKTTLFNGIIKTNSGIVSLVWDGKDKNYNILPIGLYICHLEVIDRNTGKSKTDKAPIMIGTELK